MKIIPAAHRCLRVLAPKQRAGLKLTHHRLLFLDFHADRAEPVGKGLLVKLISLTPAIH